MKKMRLAIAAIAALSISAHAGKNYIPAPVEPIPVPVEVVPPLGLYIGGGLTYAKSSCQCDTSVKFSDGSTSRVRNGKSYGVHLKLGYNYNEYIGIEGRYIYTPWGDKDRTIKHYGLYIKPTYPVNEHFDIYALLGYGKTECETIKQSYKGFAWGAGAEYTFNKKVEGRKDGLGVYIEYLRPLKKTGNKNIKIDMVNVGASYNF